MKAWTLLVALPLGGCMTLTPADARIVNYACEGGDSLTVVYSGGTARIENPGGPRVELMRLTLPDGVMYSSYSRKIYGDGEVIEYAVGRGPRVTCRAVAAP